MKKQIIAAGFFSLALLFPAFSGAQAQMMQPQAAYDRCAVFNRDFGFGSRNRHDGDDISALQQYLGISPTGYFGSLTRAKLRAFQASRGISATGYFGPLTRQSIVTLMCGQQQDQAPVISSVSPSSGTVGSQATIAGSGFSNSQNYVLIDGGTSGGAISSYDGANLTFTIPNSVGAPCNLFTSGMACPMYARLITPGTHTISVQTANGTSNSVQFTVTGPACAYGNCGTNQPPVINGGNFPTTLTVNQTGTWTVNASDPENGSLNYSVNWGDNGQCNYPYTCGIASPSAAIQQASTFTHSFANPGTYTITFTVTDSAGLSAQTTTSVLVTSQIPAGAPSLSYLSPSSGTPGTYVTIYGTGFAPSGNTILFNGNAIVSESTGGTDFSSSNGTTLTFRIPYGATIQCPSNAICAQPPYQAGNYSVVISNSYGTSNSLTFSFLRNM